MIDGIGLVAVKGTEVRYVTDRSGRLMASKPSDEGLKQLLERGAVESPRYEGMSFQVRGLVRANTMQRMRTGQEYFVLEHKIASYDPKHGEIRMHDSRGISNFPYLSMS